MKSMKAVIYFWTIVSAVTVAWGEVGGRLEVWHPVSLTFGGPHASEADASTFWDYRLTVTFRNGGAEYVVPGYFAADGDAGRSHATAGNQWRVMFAPDRPGEWSYEAELVKGDRIAVREVEGVSAELEGAKGSFRVEPSRVSPASVDFRGKGRLEYVGKHYQRFSGSGEYFIQGGAGSPENFLAFDGFDGTYDYEKRPEFPALGEDQLHHYGPHRKDWSEGDPLWTDEDGQDSKGIVGLVNYVSAQGLNSFYLMPLTYEGDGCDVWPWVDPTQRDRFDVSKLDQWGYIFQHMQEKGVHIHMLVTETENENLFELRDGGAPFADTRKLYYRELIARFSHLLALTWDLGEECGWDDEKGGDIGLGNSHEQRRLFSAYIKGLDPYDHPLKIHEIEIAEIYPQLKGFEHFDGPALQRHKNYNTVVQEHLEMSRSGGRPWLVSMSEPLGWEFGLRPNTDDPTREAPRKDVLWGTLMGGGSGVEWYFGWQNNAPTSDLSSEDLRVRDTMWSQTKIALEFFQRYLPFHEMRAANGLIEGEEDYVFAKSGQVYAVYLREGGSADLNFANVEGLFDIRWYDPIKGGSLQIGSISEVEASPATPLGTPPYAEKQDWAVLLRRR